MRVIAEAAARRDAQQAWLAAQYVRFAYHQPNEMPPDPGVDRPKGLNTEAEVAEAKAIMRAMARGRHGG